MSLWRRRKNLSLFAFGDCCEYWPRVQIVDQSAPNAILQLLLWAPAGEQMCNESRQHCKFCLWYVKNATKYLFLAGMSWKEMCSTYWACIKSELADHLFTFVTKYWPREKPKIDPEVSKVWIYMYGKYLANIWQIYMEYMGMEVGVGGLHRPGSQGVQSTRLWPPPLTTSASFYLSPTLCPTNPPPPDKWQTVSAQIVNCIFPNCLIYLSRLPAPIYHPVFAPKTHLRQQSKYMANIMQTVLSPKLYHTNPPLPWKPIHGKCITNYVCRKCKIYLAK